MNQNDRQIEDANLRRQDDQGSLFNRTVRMVVYVTTISCVAWFISFVYGVIKNVQI